MNSYDFLDFIHHHGKKIIHNYDKHLSEIFRNSYPK